MHEGKFPKLTNLLQLAEIGQINRAHALIIIDERRSAVEKWPIFA